jgi:hypothetical protein
MRSEREPEAPGEGQVWHALVPGGADSAALCGRTLTQEAGGAPPTPGGHPEAEQLCAACMALVERAMAVRQAAGVHAETGLAAEPA